MVEKGIFHARGRDGGRWEENKLASPRAPIYQKVPRKSIKENDFFDKSASGCGANHKHFIQMAYTGVAGGGVSLKESLCMGWGGPPPQVGTNSCVCDCVCARGV